MNYLYPFTDDPPVPPDPPPVIDPSIERFTTWVTRWRSTRPAQGRRAIAAGLVGSPRSPAKTSGELLARWSPASCRSQERRARRLHPEDRGCALGPLDGSPASLAGGATRRGAHLRSRFAAFERRRWVQTGQMPDQRRRLPPEAMLGAAGAAAKQGPPPASGRPEPPTGHAPAELLLALDADPLNRITIGAPRWVVRQFQAPGPRQDGSLRGATQRLSPTASRKPSWRAVPQ